MRAFEICLKTAIATALRRRAPFAARQLDA